MEILHRYFQNIKLSSKTHLGIKEKATICYILKIYYTRYTKKFLKNTFWNYKNIKIFVYKDLQKKKIEIKTFLCLNRNYVIDKINKKI